MFKEPRELRGLCRNRIAGKLTIFKYSEPEEMTTETIYPQDIEFNASLSLETQRIPDLWHYLLSGGKLISPVTQRPVEESITINNPIEEAELAAFRKIQEWFSKNEEGVAVWISPASSRDLSTKIIISEIVGAPKRLRNRAVCLDLDAQECIILAKQMGLNDEISGENLIDYPIFPRATFPEILDLLVDYEPRQAGLIASGEDYFIKERLKLDLALGQALLIGPYAPSCGAGMQSAFNVMYGNSQKMGESWSYHGGTCRVCGESTTVGPCNICKDCEKKF